MLRSAIWRFRGLVAPRLPLPTHLPSGERWLSYNDVMGRTVWLRKAFETGAQEFFGRFLTAGMSVVECGAHQGYFTLPISRRIGPSGNLLAFEPSERDRERLFRNLKMNGLHNVTVDARAVGAAAGLATFYICEFETGCNSLRPPATPYPAELSNVQVVTLDEALAEHRFGDLDLIKIDAEGAELGILQGAPEILRNCNGVVFCELADVRTDPWGYKALEIYRFLEERGFNWHAITVEGTLIDFPERENFNENLVAVPRRKMAELQRRGLLADAGARHRSNDVN